MNKNSIAPTCTCGNDDEFQIKEIRYLYRKQPRHGELTGKIKEVVRGQLLIVVSCILCGESKALYVNNLDADQFAAGEEPKFYLQKNKNGL